MASRFLKNSIFFGLIDTESDLGVAREEEIGALGERGEETNKLTLIVTK